MYLKLAFAKVAQCCFPAVCSSSPHVCEPGEWVSLCVQLCCSGTSLGFQVGLGVPEAKVYCNLISLRVLINICFLFGVWVHNAELCSKRTCLG